MVIEGSGLPVSTAATANQIVTNNILHENLEEWPPRKKSERLVVSEENLQNKSWHTCADDKRYQLLSYEASQNHFNTGHNQTPVQAMYLSVKS